MFGLVFFTSAAILVVLVFEVVMFLDVLKNTKLTDTQKLIWAGGMLLLHPFIAIIYYFVAHTPLTYTK